jgi:hypothetical protein
VSVASAARRGPGYDVSIPGADVLARLEPTLDEHKSQSVGQLVRVEASGTKPLCSMTRQGFTTNGNEGKVANNLRLEDLEVGLEVG